MAFVPPMLGPAGLSGRPEILGVDEVQAVVEVHLELATTELAGDPAFRIVEERRHLGPDPGELLEDLLGGGPVETAVAEVAREVRLQELPAARGNHDDTDCSTPPDAALRPRGAGAAPWRSRQPPSGAAGPAEELQKNAQIPFSRVVEALDLTP